MNAQAIQLREAQAASQQEGSLVLAWERRRPAWTRTDTARWLDDRSEPLLAWLRRRAARSPHRYCRQMGHWLKDHDHARFLRVHDRLRTVGDADRARMTLDEALR